MDVGPPPPGGLERLSLHNLALIYLGVHVLDNMDLTAVSEAAAGAEPGGVRGHDRAV